MYPRNAASPPRIAVGAVVQISDGAVQTSGCTVRVIEQGGAEGDGGGTTAYSTDGVVLYTPTQAETDQSAFVLIAKKTGCIPVAMTVITSASATAGCAGLDWAAITAPTTTVNLSGTTVKTATDVETDTADIQSRLPAALVSGRIDASVGAMASGVITASSIAADAITDAKVASDVTIASVTGSVGSIAAGGITAASIATGAIDADALATDAVAEIADGVWDEARSGHTTAGTYGEANSTIVSGTCITGTLSTTACTTNLTEATDDHYIGRTIVWVTGVLTGQASAITDYVGSSKTLTYTAVTDAPANNDRFVLV